MSGRSLRTHIHDWGCRAAGSAAMLRHVSVENVLTRYGPLGRLPALAAQLVISKAGSAAIIALNTVHLSLGLRPNRAANIPPSQTPADRWHQLMIGLFHSLVDDGRIESRLPLPIAITPAEEATVDNLLGVAGAFLLAESRTLDKQINTWIAVEFGDDVPERETDEIAAMRAHVIAADNAGQKLLRMVGKGTWREALKPQVEAASDAPVAELGDNFASATMLLSRAQPSRSFEDLVLWLSDSVKDTQRDSYTRLQAAHQLRAAHQFQAALVDSMWQAISQSIVVIADFTRARVDAATQRVAAWAENLVALDFSLGRTVLHEVVVTALDGRQTDPIALECGPSKSLRTDCLDALSAAMQAVAPPDLPDSEQPHVLRPLDVAPVWPSEPDAVSIQERIEDLASALAFAVDTVEPQHIFVLSDLPVLEEPEHDVTRFFTLSAELQEHLSRLRESSLSFAEISVTVAPMADPASPQLWRALCGASAKLTLLSHLQDAPAATSSTQSVRVATARCRRIHNAPGTDRVSVRKSTCPRAITILVNVEEESPRRVLARASAAVLSAALVVAVASAGAGFALAGTGPGLPTAIATLVGLGTGAAGLLWSRRTESVNALSSVASAAARVLRPESTIPGPESSTAAGTETSEPVNSQSSLA